MGAKKTSTGRSAPASKPGPRLRELSRYLEAPQEPGCPTPGCDDAEIGVCTRPEADVVKAKLKSTQRIPCKRCRREFPIRWSAIAGQRKPHLDRIVFEEIVTRKPVGGIARIAELGPEAVRDRIDVIHRPCAGFVGQREAEAQIIRRKYVRLCIDRDEVLRGAFTSAFRDRIGELAVANDFLSRKLRPWTGMSGGR